MFKRRLVVFGVTLFALALGGLDLGNLQGYFDGADGYFDGSGYFDGADGYFDGADGGSDGNS